jgi:hypothetical protein
MLASSSEMVVSWNETTKVISCLKKLIPRSFEKRMESELFVYKLKKRVPRRSFKVVFNLKYYLVYLIQKTSPKKDYDINIIVSSDLRRKSIF